MSGSGTRGGPEQQGWPEKSWWGPDLGNDPTGVLPRSLELFDGSFSWPVMVLRESAMQHNVAALAAFVRANGLLLAPHGKTTMAPALYTQQLAAGAWGITVATGSQARVARRAGVRTIVIANEVLDPTALAWIAAQTHYGTDIMMWVDSVAGVEVAAAGVLAAAGGEPVDSYLPRGVAVLVDVGYEGGRTGCRNDSAIDAVVSSVASAAGLRLAGVAGYEGGLATVDEVQTYLRRVQDVANRLHERGLLPDDAIVTCGGSAYFDLVAKCWADGWRPGFAPRRLLRSGAYVTHDDGVYVGKTPYNRITGHLEAAIEVWAQVISPGDPGRVILGMGKRDAPYDEGLPIPKAIRRAGSVTIEPLVECAVERMDDQHAYLAGPGDLRPGDLVCFGISHPCTAFDKWRLLPVVDDHYRVVDLIRTYF